MKSIFQLFSLSLFAVSTLAAPAARINTRDVSQADLNRLQFFSEYAAASYCYNNVHGPSGTKIQCAPGNCKDVATAGAFVTKAFTSLTDGTENMAGFVAVDEKNKYIVMSFRGTANENNMMSDLSFIKVDTDLCDDCSVHEGFWNVWKAVEPTVRDAVSDAMKKYPGFNLVATGHSLGGAVASLGAAALRNSGLKVMLITYGQPRIGGKKVSDYISKQPGGTYRVTHTSDIVPQVPPHDLDLFDPWVNIYPEYYITSDALPVQAKMISVEQGDWNMAGNSGTESLTSTSLLDFVEGILSGEDLANHRHYFSTSISSCNATAST